MPIFEVQIKRTRRADHPNSVSFPKHAGAYVLVFNDDWNDYSWFNSFALWDFPNGEKRCIGELKILNRDEEVPYTLIKEGFNKPLDSDFCSMGQDITYYHRLKNLLSEKECNEVLYFLRDCRHTPQIYEDFKSHGMMKDSLLRDSASIKAFTEAPLILSGLNPEEAFSFAYNCLLKYNSDSPLKWKVNFDYFPSSFRRCVGIIGENGVGKTRMLSSFVNDFFAKDSNRFNHKPIFSGILVVNSTRQDKYPNEREVDEMLKDNSAYSNKYYRQLSLDSFEEVDTILNCIDSLEYKPQIHQESVMTWFRRSVVNCISPDVADNLFILEEEKYTYKDCWDGTKKEDIKKIWKPRDRKSLRKSINILSSGQLYCLALIAFLYSNIHMSSLVILDEPETHLHPSVIINLMNCLYEVLNRYESYAIVATHSPLIIREIVRENVYRFKRIDKCVPSIKKVAFDTFGEDISTLFLNIFDYDERNSVFTKTVRELRAKNQKFGVDDIIKEISIKDSVNLNARMRIDEIIDNLDAQSEEEYTDN